MKPSILRLLWNPSGASRRDSEELIRSELFSVERLEQHAESLAAAQPVTTRPTRGRPLATRLRDNGRVLLGAYRAIAAAIREERAITPAAEWLVDNFHVVEEQIREIRDDLPRGFYRQLPKLSDRAARGLSARLRAGLGVRRAHRQPLRPADARAGSCAPTSACSRSRSASSGRWRSRCGSCSWRTCGAPPSSSSAAEPRAGRPMPWPIALLASRRPGGTSSRTRPCDASSRDALSREFAVQLVQRLRDHDPSVTPAVHWLDERLAAQGTTADELVRQEHQRQGAMNVTVRNVITSMRLMSAVDWAEFFESVSLVDVDAPRRQRLRGHGFSDARSLSPRNRGTRARLEALGARGDSARDSCDPARAAEPRRRRRCRTARREQDPGYFLISSGTPDLREGARISRPGEASGPFAPSRGRACPAISERSRSSPRSSSRHRSSRWRSPGSAKRRSGCSRCWLSSPRRMWPWRS